MAKREAKVTPVKTTPAKAAEAKEEAVKGAAGKAEETQAAKTEEPKKEEEVKAETVKKETTAKKTVKKTTAAKKTESKKAERVEEIYLQFHGQEIFTKEIMDKAKQAYISEGHRAFADQAHTMESLHVFWQEVLRMHVISQHKLH